MILFKKDSEYYFSSFASLFEVGCVNPWCRYAQPYWVVLATLDVSRVGTLLCFSLCLLIICLLWGFIKLLCRSSQGQNGAACERHQCGHWCWRLEQVMYSLWVLDITKIFLHCYTLNLSVCDEHLNWICLNLYYLWE